MGKTKRKAPRKRLPQITWIPTEPNSSGNAQWQSRCGMLRLTLSNQCQGIAMPARWILWRFKAGGWVKVLDHAFRGPVEKRAREIMAEYEALDDSE